MCVVKTTTLIQKVGVKGVLQEPYDTFQTYINEMYIE